MNAMRLLLLLAALWPFHATAQECATPTDDEMSAVRESFKMVLLDNESARFANVCKHDSDLAGDAFCGLVNARNQLGAYSGFRRFYSIPEEGSVEVEPSDEADALAFAIVGLCFTCGDCENQP